MKRVALGLVLAVGGAASADIELFWSTTGKSGPLMYSMATTNFLPIDSATPVSLLFPGTYDVFLWGRFVGNSNPPPGWRIADLDLAFGGDATTGVSAAYLHNKTGSGSYRRWDSAGGGLALDDPMTNGGVSDGIEFLQPPNSNNDLYFPATQEFLVGAVEVTGLANQSLIMNIENVSFTPAPWHPEHSPAVLTFAPEGGSLWLALAGLVLRRR